MSTNLVLVQFKSGSFFSLLTFPHYYQHQQQQVTDALPIAWYIHTNSCTTTSYKLVYASQWDGISLTMSTAGGDGEEVKERRDTPVDTIRSSVVQMALLPSYLPVHKAWPRHQDQDTLGYIIDHWSCHNDDFCSKICHHQQKVQSNVVWKSMFAMWQYRVPSGQGWTTKRFYLLSQGMFKVSCLWIKTHVENILQ